MGTTHVSWYSADVAALRFGVAFEDDCCTLLWLVVGLGYATYESFGGCLMIDWSSHEGSWLRTYVGAVGVNFVSKIDLSTDLWFYVTKLQTSTVKKPYQVFSLKLIVVNYSKRE